MFIVDENTAKADVKNIFGRAVVDGKLITCVMLKEVETLCADAYEVDEDGNATYCGSIQFETLEELDAKFDDVVESARELFAKKPHSTVN